VKLEKFLATVLREAYKRQVEEVMDTLEERLECCTSGRSRRDHCPVSAALEAS
jgi:hypothetical protein